MILLANDDPLPAECKVAPVNNFLHSLFSSVHIELNTMCITQGAGLYSYRAMIENLINYGCDARDTHLRSSFFKKDTAGLNGEDSNVGHVTRRGWTNNSEFDLESFLHCDLMNQNKYMLSNLPMTLKFYKSKPEFSLMTAPNDVNKYKIKITEAVLVIRKVKIAPAVAIAHEAALLKTTAKYPITRVEVKHFTIPKDLMTTSIDNLFIGQLPKRIIVGFVDQGFFTGSFTSNPFIFDHFHHRFLEIQTDSTLKVAPLEPNFETSQYMQSYNSLIYATGVNYSDCGVGISHEEFAKGYALSVFDLTQDISASSSYWSPQQTGILSLNIHFSKTLAKPITLILFSEFDNLIEIDRFRNVTTDFKR